MKKQGEQGTDTGQSQESKNRQSGAVSRTRKTEQESPLESATKHHSQSKNGSPTSETPKEKLILENGNESGEELIPQKAKRTKSTMPVPKFPSLEKKTILALKRLKVKPEALKTTPQITPLLKSSVKGGLKAALDAMRFATEDTEISAFLKVYDKTSEDDRDRVSWEAISIAAKVNPKHLLGAIQLAVQNHCWNRSRFIAISNHPDVMDKRVKYAKMAGGERDRTQLDISLGFLQSPKGPTFIGKQVAVFGGKSQGSKDSGDSKTVDAEVESGDGFDDLFPSPNEIQEKLVPIRQRLLKG